MREAHRACQDDALAILGVPYVRPTGAFYLMIDTSRTAVSSDGFVRELLSDHAFAVVPGSAFGARRKRWVRVSPAARDAEVSNRVSRLARALVAGEAAA